MTWLRLLIWCYIFGLLTFYTYAVFDTRAWDIVYFGWSKIGDCGILAWIVIYYNGNKALRKVIKPLLVFSFIRLAVDVQSFFTGIGVNNEWLVALVFLLLIVSMGILVFIRESKFYRFLNKNVP